MTAQRGRPEVRVCAVARSATHPGLERTGARP